MNVGELEMRKVEVSSICISLEREREKKKLTRMDVLRRGGDSGSELETEASQLDLVPLRLRMLRARPCSI